MSLFGSLMGDMDRDPIFGSHSRAMNRMMNSFFRSPFGPQEDGLFHHQAPSMNLMPFGAGSMLGPMGFGFPDMSQMMQQAHNPHSHSFSSMSVMSYSSGPDGRPQVYQASSSTRQAPGGVRETRKTLTDTRSGVKKMGIGHHIGDRAYIREREMNLRTGQREENEELINIDEHESEAFDSEFRRRAYGYQSHSSHTPLMLESSPYHHHSRSNGRTRTRPSASASAPTVTIEELPPSDNEESGEPLRALPAPPMATSSRRSAGSRARDRAQRAMKRSKKY